MPPAVTPDIANDWLQATPAARDFGAAYRSQRDALRAATDEVMLASPALHVVMMALTPAQHDETYAAYWAGIEHAFDGDWQARVRSLVRTGRLFARAGADLSDWERLSAANTRAVRSELFARFQADSERLLATLDVMQSFFDRSFCAFSDAYVNAAEHRVHQAETMYRLSSFGQAIVDARGVVYKPNDAFLALYGLGVQWSGGDFFSLFDPAALADAREVHFPTARATGRLDYDTVHRRKDGSLFPVRIEAVRIGQNEDRSTWGVSVHDLTDRRQVEALRARSAALEAENARVHAASRAKSEFLANMSHELRTPLNSILGFSELLAHGEVGPLTEQQLDFVQDIHRSGRHLLHLINDVLDLAKVEAGKLEFEPAPVDLAVLVEDVTRLVGASAAARSLRVETDVADDARNARLDASRFEQVLFNYLSNAVKFSLEGGRVQVRVRAEGAFVRLSVQDGGVGISAEDQPRLFHVFEQLDAGRAKRHGGTGLGLALTKRIVEAQGGRVEVESAVGVGSTFHALLPRG